MGGTYQRALVAALVLAAAGPAVLLIVANRAILDALVAGRLEPILAGNLALLLGLSVLLVGGLAAAVAALALAAPIQRLREGVALMLGPNRRHRLVPPERADLAEIARGVNALADRADRAEAEGAAEVAAAARDLATEHETLASVLFALPDGVVVCNAQLQIVLSNEAARRLLSRPALPLRRGESIYAYLDAARVGPLVERLAPPADGPRLERATLPRPDGAPVDLAATVARGAAGAHHYVFVLALPPDAPASVPLGAEDDAVGRQVRALLGHGGFYDPEPPTDPAAEAHADARLADLAYVVFDLETTGLEPERDAILALGAVRVRGGRVLHEDHFLALVDPGRPIPPASTRVHGITDAMVAGQPPLDAVLPQFAAFIAGSVPVAHVARFDLAFLNPRLQALGLPPVPADTLLDTLLLCYALFPSWGGYNLEEVAARLDLPVRGRHTALGDALLTAEILVRLLGVLEQRGVATLGAVLRVQRGDVVRKLLGALRAELTRE